MESADLHTANVGEFIKVTRDTTLRHSTVESEKSVGCARHIARNIVQYRKVVPDRGEKSNQAHGMYATFATVLREKEKFLSLNSQG